MSIVQSIIGAVSGGNQPPAYWINLPGGYNEDGTVAFQVYWDHARNQVVYWSIASDSATAGVDFTSNAGYSGAIYTNGSGGTTVAYISNVNDNTTEGTEWYWVRVGTYPGGNDLAQQYVNINDTSQAPPYTGFDIYGNIPSDGRYLPWASTTNGVGANITNISGNWQVDNTYGGGVIMDNTNHSYITINGSGPTTSTFTLSIAMNFQPDSSKWNPIFSGSTYGQNGVFAYAVGDGTQYVSVGTGTQQLTNPTPTTISGLAWWDFVYSGTLVKVYRNNVKIIDGTLTTSNVGFPSGLMVGSRWGQPNDWLKGTVYRIKYTDSSLDDTAIANQYNSIKTLYGLP